MHRNAGSPHWKCICIGNGFVLISSLGFKCRDAFIRISWILPPFVDIVEISAFCGFSLYWSHEEHDPRAITSRTLWLPIKNTDDGTKGQWHRRMNASRLWTPKLEINTNTFPVWGSSVAMHLFVLVYIYIFIYIYSGHMRCTQLRDMRFDRQKATRTTGQRDK